MQFPLPFSLWEAPRIVNCCEMQMVFPSLGLAKKKNTKINSDSFYTAIDKVERSSGRRRRRRCGRFGVVLHAAKLIKTNPFNGKSLLLPLPLSLPLLLP